MTGKTHFLGGIAFSAAALVILKNMGMEVVPEAGIVCALSSGISALLPDLDEPNSTISRKLPLLSFIFSANRLGKKVRALNPFLSKSDRRHMRMEVRDASHRGITHYFITCFLVGFTALILSFHLENAFLKMALFGVLPGYLSHILLDLVSGRVPALAPFYRRGIGICFFRTGGLFDVLLWRMVFLIVIGLEVLLIL